MQGFPTLKWFDGKGGEEGVEDYKGGRDLDSLVEFVKGKTGIKPKVKKEGGESAVVMLDDRTFGEGVSGERDVLVAFTAPWCGRKFSLSLLPLF